MQIDGAHRAGELAQLAPEEELRQLLRELAERLEVREPGRAPLGVARAQRRRDELLEQRRLAVGGGPERRAGAAARSRSARAGAQTTAMSASVSA